MLRPCEKISSPVHKTLNERSNFVMFSKFKAGAKSATAKIGKAAAIIAGVVVVYIAIRWIRQRNAARAAKMALNGAWRFQDGSVWVFNNGTMTPPSSYSSFQSGSYWESTPGVYSMTVYNTDGTTTDAVGTLSPDRTTLTVSATAGNITPMVFVRVSN